jgi:hypothetical protein
VEKNGVSFRTRTRANLYFAAMVEGRGGQEQGSFRTRTRANKSYVMVKGQGGKEQCPFRTRTGANNCCIMVEGRGGKEQCPFRTRTGANILLYHGGRAGWKSTVSFSHMYWSQ